MAAVQGRHTVSRDHQIVQGDSNDMITYPPRSGPFDVTIEAQPIREKTPSDSLPSYRMIASNRETFDRWDCALDSAFYSNLGTGHEIFNETRVIALLRAMCAERDYEVIVRETRIYIEITFHENITIRGQTIDDTITLQLNRCEEDEQSRTIMRQGAQIHSLQDDLEKARVRISQLEREYGFTQFTDQIARHFAPIAPAQERFAQEIYAGIMIGTPLVFPVARSWGTPDVANSMLLPLYAHSIVRFVDLFETCAHSLAHVSCERLIITGYGYMDYSQCSQTRKIYQPQGHHCFDDYLQIMTMHRRWHNKIAGSNEHLVSVPHNCREIMFVAPLDGSKSLVISTIQGMEAAFKKYTRDTGIVPRIIIDSRIGFTELRGIFVDAHVADLSGRDLVTYEAQDIARDLEAARADEHCAAIAKDFAREPMTFEQWYGI